MSVGPAFTVPPVPRSNGVGPPLTKSAFRARANAICRRVDAAITGMPKGTTPSIATADARESLLLSERGITGLATLSAPVGLAGSYAGMLDDARRAIALIVTAAQREQTGISPSVRTLDRQVKSLDRSANRAAGALGLFACAQDPTPRGGPSAVRTAGGALAHSVSIAGAWTATGRVLATHDSAEQTPGAVLQRAWVIAQTCQAGSCRLVLARQISFAGPGTAAPLVAPLHYAHGIWSTTFSEAHVACQGSTPGLAGVENSTWEIRTTASELHAVELTETSGPGCVTGTTEIAWSAVRAGTPSPGA